MKNKFESLAEEQKPDAPPARAGPPKPITIDTSAGPTVIESQPTPSNISYDQNVGATYDAGSYEEAGGYEETYEEGAYEEGAYEEGAYEEGAYEESYEEGAYEETYEETYEEAGAYEEGAYEEAYEEGAYEEGAYEEAYEEGYEEAYEEAYEEGGYEEGGELWATALYDYNGENPDDLSFYAGDSISVLDQSDPSGWWKGSCNGVEGFFPSNFVELA